MTERTRICPRCQQEHTHWLDNLMPPPPGFEDYAIRRINLTDDEVTMLCQDCMTGITEQMVHDHVVEAARQVVATAARIKADTGYLDDDFGELAAAVDALAARLDALGHGET